MAALPPDQPDNEPMAYASLCDHAWQYNKPAHASVAIRICSFCHTIDGEDLMQTLDEYAQDKPVPTNPHGVRAMPEPEDPITQLAAAAVQLHEAYLAYLNAGFTEEQAFSLTKTILTASLDAQR